MPGQLLRGEGPVIRPDVHGAALDVGPDRDPFPRFVDRLQVPTPEQDQLQPVVPGHRSSPLQGRAFFRFRDNGQILPAAAPGQPQIPGAYFSPRIRLRSFSASS